MQMLSILGLFKVCRTSVIDLPEIFDFEKNSKTISDIVGNIVKLTRKHNRCIDVEMFLKKRCCHLLDKVILDKNQGHTLFSL